MDESLDKFDRLLLQVLQSEDGISLNTIAQRINLSSSQCSRRISRLKEKGIISRQATLLNASSLGLDVQAFINVTLSQHDATTADKFQQQVLNNEKILECHAITGAEGDYLLKVIASNNEALRQFVMTELLGLECISKVHTSLSLGSIKTTTRLPLQL
ncbi:AsnC family transcriptional regulator [Endozoicomonas sp. OPT23]|uniref:Lrp/AsnC family transcriptional regulator n=1 Tax=Endozoicomonas sp. OPT23 TaxID=2072845 RepID=UPI00129A9F06|nr:Lrp/AsnC family transcriptional regulator [Endozoicomonas sp. OPT23]MRI34387.1 AsnC family transcriptional regulator [Endozoicomonas sp. OPT23]